MTTREKAQKPLDAVPNSELEPVVAFLASRGEDPMIPWLDCRPEEDEEVSADEEAAAAEGRADVAAARTISHEEMLRRHR